jgi:hypothetical protein
MKEGVMARPDEEFQEDEPHPPRRRSPRRDDEDEVQDAPRPGQRQRTDHDDDDELDYDRPRRTRIQRSWLDAQFADTSIVLLVLFPLCCGMFAWIFGIVGVAACTDPKARRNAIIILVASAIWVAVAITYAVVRTGIEGR